MDEISKKIIVTVCPLCKGKRRKFFESIKDSGEELIYFLCTACGLVFQSPRMGDADIIEFYKSYYRKKVQGTETPTEKDLRIQAGRARHLLKLLQRKVEVIKRHLDVGSSSGALLHEINAAYGCEGIGIEPGDAYRAASQSLGFQTFQHLQDLPLGTRYSFDFVSIVQTLEHIPDPVAYLSHIRRNWMAPNGILLVETPNLFGHRSLELTHLIAFSPRTLRQTLELAGFKILKLNIHGEPRSPILRLYITIIARALPVNTKLHKPRFRANLVRQRRLMALWTLGFLTEKIPSYTWRDLPQL